MLRGIAASLARNVAASYRGVAKWWHLAAAVITAGLVLSGFDWWFFGITRRDEFIPFIYAAGIGGFFVPVLVPVVLYAWGGASRRMHLMRAGIAAAQAVVISWCISSFYKALTGRVEPEFLTSLMDDRSRIWNFGFFEYGIFWGWPSSHTAVAFALAACLSVCFARSRAVRLASYAYAVFIGFGAGVGFHWFSDVIAGAIVGNVVGLAVGRSLAHGSLKVHDPHD